jgi:proteic killer suppression protein
MIKSFACKDTEKLFGGGPCNRWTSIRSVVDRKLQLLDSAASLDALRSPPGNRFESLRGDRVGQYCIRINKQWRICFVWSELGVFDVEITDYH